jgi:hypothetical protein
VAFQLEIKEQMKDIAKKNNTNRVKKHKQHNTVLNSPVNAGKQTDRMTHVQTNFQLSSNLSTHRLPTLTLHPKRHKRVSKESYFI